MSDTHRLEDVATYNHKSLRTLVRGLDLSQGQFSLILVRCNYTRLRDRMLQQLQKLSPVRIHRLALPQSVKTLFAPIAAEIGDNPPPALTVLGLESLENIEPVLTATNLIREEFRKHFPFPLLLWATDEVLRKLIRLAPDFESWATTVKFELPTEKLIDFLHQKTETVFARVLEPDTAQLPHPDFCLIAADDRLNSELESACKDLQSRAYQLQPDIAATLEFIRGLQADENGHSEAALEHYRQSLAFWQNSAFLIVNSDFIENLEYRIQNLLERQGVILFYTGTSSASQAQRQPGDSRRWWQQALEAFEQSVTAFEAAERQDLVAQVVGQLGEVLRHLEAWEQLQTLAKKYLPAHQAAGSQALAAQDLGFLAEVALQRNQPAQARELAQQAICTLADAPEPQPQQRGLYLLLLARASRRLSQESDAASSLETARQETDAHSDPKLYINILQELRQIYFERGKYLEAFRIKQEQRAIEHEYGFRAFIGAGALQPHRKVGQQKLSAAKEIEATGRQRDVSRLIERISRSDRKLTVILGPSGVGKSSILTAGLVPALQHTATGSHKVLPVLVQSYTDCMQTFGRELAKALSPRGEQPAKPSLSGALQQLAQNGERNLLTVLIFDQFEEFFFVCTEAEGRQKFWVFLRDALNIPFVKVILSLRSDYRHYLYYILEWEQQTQSRDCSSILNSIISEEARYYLGNFSPREARAAIEQLTQMAQFPVEPALIEALVRDLAGSTEEVRPIELQLVGAQLQADGITTLGKYQQLGENPKAKLVKHSIESAIKDCGASNKDAAWKVLALLTNEKGTRPLRTRDELAELLQSDSDKLDLILEILTGSGLVVRLPAAPENRYQLVHDYLVEPIRQTYDFGREVRLQVAEAAKRRSTANNRTLRQELRQAPLFLQRAVVGMGAVAVILALAASVSQNSAQIRAITASSKALYNSHLEFEALIESLRAGKILKTWLGSMVPADIRMEAVTALQQAVYKVRERNRLQGHSNTVAGVSFSPDGLMLASASSDGTVKLWNRSGKEIKTLRGHTAEVYSAIFSPDGQTLASASADGTVKLWSRDGVLRSTLKGHAGEVFKVSFSPDGELIATAGKDKTVKLWRRDGELLRDLKGHTDQVWGVSFSPDGQTLASASADKTVKLWRLDGSLLRTLKGHTGKVFDVSFSPDGEIASAAGDGTVKLWKRDGTLWKTLSGHENTVWCVGFSPDGQTLATASADRTVKLWSKDGRLLNTFGGHIFSVRSLSFSPDGKMLASAGEDNSVKLWSVGGTPSLRVLQHQALVRRASYSRSGTLATASFDSTIRLWNKDDRLLRTLTGHTDWVTDVSFSPDGETLASASQDKTVKLWNRSGQLRSTLEADSHGVYSVAFSPQGEIATAGTDKTVKLWLTDGVLLRTLTGRSEGAHSLAFSPDGQLIASAGSTEVKLWRFDGTEYKTLENHIAGVYAVGFSPDGQTFVTASADRTVKLWNRDGRLLQTILGHRDSVYSASFSPDGQIIASGSKDKTVKLWNLDGNLLGTLAAHSDSVWDVRFSPDGKTLASAGEDKKVILWNLDLDDLMARGCDWMRDYLHNPTANLSDQKRHLCDGIGPRK
jgi:WD40 repeat protein